MDGPTLVRTSRSRSGLSKRAFAERVGTSRMALDLIEAGERTPGLDLAARIADAGGLTLTLTPRSQPAVPVATLAGHIDSLDIEDPIWSWRWLTGDFVANAFVPAITAARTAMLADRPASTGDARWDHFVDALAEHLAVHAEIRKPAWVEGGPIDHGAFWWPVHGDLPSTRAAALAHSPASFARRGILVDGRDLPRVTP